MTGKMKTIIGVFAFAAVLTGAILGYNMLTKNYNPSPAEVTDTTTPTPSDDAVATATKAETAAPDFTVYDADGKKVKLSDFAGQPVVVNFWASWCPPCKSELPDFDDAAAKYKGEVVFLMVNMTDGQRETQAKAQMYVDGQGFTFSVYFDTKSSAADVYGISSIPTTVFVDKQGNISAGYVGAIDASTLESGIEKILS